MKTQQSQLDATFEFLREREARYGKFRSHARITQRFKAVLASELRLNSNKQLNSTQQESLEMIFHKIGRIINGDPDYEDNWDDIAGYAMLVAEDIREQKHKNDSSF